LGKSPSGFCLSTGSRASTPLVAICLAEASVTFYLMREYDLVLHLSMERHIGFLDWLGDLRFRFSLYEGHAGETVADITAKVKQWSPEVQILAHTVSQDGDSEPRPMLLCRVPGD
jgi:hypothetical protein